MFDCRERSDGLYSEITYLVAKMLDEIMLVIPSSIFFAAIVFYSVDLQGKFSIFWLFYLMVSSIGIMLAYLVAALSPNMEVANAGTLLDTSEVFFKIKLIYFWIL